MPTLKVTKKHHRHLNNPFPSSPTSSKLHVSGGALSAAFSSPYPTAFPVGPDFLLSCGSGAGLSIAHRSAPDRALWRTVPSEPFLCAAAARADADESRGSFVVRDGPLAVICNHQSIDAIETLHESGDATGLACRDLLKSVAGFPVVVVSGRLYPGSETRRTSARARYWFVLDQKNSHQVGFRVEFGELLRSPSRFSKIPRWNLVLRFRRRKLRDFRLLPPSECTELNRIYLTYSSEEDEKFYGFGEQFSYTEFKGRRVPILVQEQGIGRGDQPITFAANLVSYRSGGDWSTTYAPSPFYMTSKMRSLYLEGHNYSVFDLTKPDRVQIQIHGNAAQGRILNGDSPAALIERYTETIGRPPVLPNWIISGAVVGMQGGTEAVRRVWDQLRNHDVPVSAFWLQDWVGQRKTIIGSQLWWNWEVDTAHYAGWKELVSDLGTKNIRVMAYCNPCLVPTDEKVNRKKDLFEEAKRLDILVKDEAGEVYMMPNTAFDVAMVDFTHPEAAGWFKKILRDMVNCGVRGWMADFGEGLPLDACLYSGEDPVCAHNRYPELWARVNREFADEWSSGQDPDEGLVFFLRAGFRDSPKWAMLFWEGDQMVSWQANDGIKSSVTGLLSGGLSGFPLNHSDIGGYCAVDLPFIRYQRSEELLIRWMELNSFTIVFRTHEGNKPSLNCQFYSNARTLAHFARFAKVYEAWKFYRVELVKEASEKGLPVVRHLFLHYPHDEHVHAFTYQQFLVGSEILVVPVLDKGKKQVTAYFPLSHGVSWQHIWTGRTFSGSDNGLRGFEELVEAPLGFPAVFVKCGSPVGETFLKNLKDLSIL